VQRQNQEATSKEIDKPAQAAVEKSKLLAEQEMKDTSDSEGDTLEDLEQITMGMCGHGLVPRSFWTDVCRPQGQNHK
jgi:hypothetical protein